jgi:hypothetical protein
MRIPRYLASWRLGVLLFWGVALAQQDRLSGRWEGTVQGLQGPAKAVATFKKEGAGYTGTITGLRGDLTFKEVRVEGDKIFATAEVQAQGNTVGIKYEFALRDESLQGKGDVDFNGQTFSFTYDLKRAPAGSVASQPAQAPAATAVAPPRRESVPQPLQQQSRDYFLGQWKFKWLGRDSALSAGGPREGTVTFAPVIDGKFLEMTTEGKSEAGAFREQGYLAYDPEKKSVTIFEQRSGLALLSVGDWSSPISIRFAVTPVKAGGQTLRLRRTINVVAAHSWNLVEELSIDGGPFQRLGNALYTKAGAEGDRK